MSVTATLGDAVPSVERVPFGRLPDGRTVERITMRAGALEVAVATYGGIILALHAPDREGRLDDVVLGHDTLTGYLTESPYFGALIGRVANRIAHGRFSLDGQTHQLARNDGEQHLHGGKRGFDKALWEATSFTNGTDARVALTLVSPDGDEGYPGTLVARVEYTLSLRGELAIDYAAVTDRPTVVNLTQHSYFNLGGRSADDILRHELTVHAERFTPVGAGLVPTGAIARVHGTPFDFRAPTPIGERIAEADEQLELAGGYDHNFVLDRSESGGLSHAAHLADPMSGRTLDVHTTQPGLQFYSGNFLDGSIRGKGGRQYTHRAGLCLETQHFPDSPNQFGFPSIVLRPGDEYRTRTVFVFGAEG